MRTKTRTQCLSIRTPIALYTEPLSLNSDRRFQRLESECVKYTKICPTEPHQKFRSKCKYGERERLITAIIDNNGRIT